MIDDPRNRLAILDVLACLAPPRASQPHGTLHAAHATAVALARVGGYSSIDVYGTFATADASAGEEIFPHRRYDLLALPSSPWPYQAIYVANGGQIQTAVHHLRPDHDWAPVICSVGTTHAGRQWANLFLSAASGAMRATDGLIFKSQAAARLFAETFADWARRFGVVESLPAETIVIGNGVDVEANQRSQPLRVRLRQQMNLPDDAPVFLAFSRLSPGTKGDQAALLVRWKDVLARIPNAFLVLAGAVVDHDFVAELRALAKQAGVDERVVILADPARHLPNARQSLMSAADVFLHLTTGMEETTPLVIHEAMAHGLPVIATAWAGIVEVVTEGETGFLVPTVHAPPASGVTNALFAESDTRLAIHAGRLVACDWRAFLSAAELLGDVGRRAKMGTAARRRAEAEALPVMVQRYAAFFAATSRVAERAWSSHRPRPGGLQPLVDLGRVLAAQGAARLSPDVRVRLGDRGRLGLLTEGQTPEDADRLQRVVDCLVEGPTSLAQLSMVAGGEPNLLGAGRFLLRLLSYGLVEIDEGTGFHQPHVHSS